MYMTTNREVLTPYRRRVAQRRTPGRARVNIKTRQRNKKRSTTKRVHHVRAKDKEQRYHRSDGVPHAHGSVSALKGGSRGEDYFFSLKVRFLRTATHLDRPLHGQQSLA